MLADDEIAPPVFSSPSSAGTEERQANCHSVPVFSHCVFMILLIWCIGLCWCGCWGPAHSGQVSGYPQSICNQFTRGNCSGANCFSKLFHLKCGFYPASWQFGGLGSVHCCFQDQTQCNLNISLPRIDEPALPNSVLMWCIELDWHVGRENKPKENRRTKCLSN